MAIFVFFKNRESLANKLWIIFTLAVAIWGFGALKISMVRDAESALFYWRITHVGVILIPVLFTHFVYEFLNLKERWPVYLVYLFGVFFLSICFSDLFIKNVVWVFDSFYYDGRPPTVLYCIFTVFWFAIVAICHTLLYKASRKSDSITKIRIKYFIYGTFFSFSGGSVSFLPVFGIDVYPYANFAAALYPLIMTYAILTYRLMDIQFVFKRSIAYSLSAGLLTGFFIILVLLMSRYLSGLAGIDELRISIFSALIISFLFAPLKNRIQSLIDKLFYKTSYNYYDVIQRVSRELSAKIYLKDIQKFIVELIADTLKIKGAYFLLAGKKYYVTVYHMKPKDKSADESAARRLRMHNDAELIRLLNDRRDIIIREELPGAISQEKADIVSAEMAPFSGEAAAPIISDGELEAIMILGGKQSGDIFTDEDINLLRTISNETALSMKTASLYAEKLRTERLATVGMTATTLAHEIKNPLSSIKTFSQLLPEKYSDEEFRDTFAAIVPGEIQRIDNLVTELLTFTRNAPSSNMERIEITTLIEDSLKLLSDQFRKSNVKVIKDYSEPLYIKGERVRIKQALINILSNGCQAMENGGVLKIATVFDDKININIEDSGVGIHEKDIERVFEPFFTTKATGNGLGLTISKKIIEDHGGSISVSSRQNEGTVFTLSFEPADDVKEDYKGEQPLLWNS